jgi:hypothetical protein
LRGKIVEKRKVLVNLRRGEAVLKLLVLIYVLELPFKLFPEVIITLNLNEPTGAFMNALRNSSM